MISHINKKNSQNNLPFTSSKDYILYIFASRQNISAIHFQAERFDLTFHSKLSLTSNLIENMFIFNDVMKTTSKVSDHNMIR